MQQPLQEIDMGFTDDRLPVGIHICLIFDRDDERREIVAQYLAAGLSHGEQVRYMTDTTPPETVRSWLLEKGVELPLDCEIPSFGISTVQNAYYPSGTFDPQEYKSAMLPRFNRSKAAGFSGMRSCGEMTWALKGIPGSERLLEYEMMLNTVQAPFRFSGMCQYDARLFDGATLFHVLKVHPWMVVKGKIIHNPFYLSPDEFQQEFRE